MTKLCNIKQTFVPCPAWLQRDMLKNLRKGAQSRINPFRARRAVELLKAIDMRSVPGPRQIGLNKAIEAVVSTNKCDPKVATTTVAKSKSKSLTYKIWQKVKAPIRRLLRR